VLEGDEILKQRSRALRVLRDGGHPSNEGLARSGGGHVAIASVNRSCRLEQSLREAFCLAFPEKLVTEPSNGL